jgi:hypothetical protein
LDKFDRDITWISSGHTLFTRGVVPTGKVQPGFNAFTLKVDTLNYPPVSDELWAKRGSSIPQPLLAFPGSGGSQVVVNAASQAYAFEEGIALDGQLLAVTIGG